MMNRSICISTTLLLIFGMLLAGCETTQSVVDIRQHPTKDVTLVHTVEQGGWNPAGDRFWHCVQEGQQLLCEPVCGDDVKCPPAPGLIRADASAQARIGDTPTAHEPVVKEEADDDVEVHTTVQEADDEVSAEDGDDDGDQ